MIQVVAVVAVAAVVVGGGGVLVGGVLCLGVGKGVRVLDLVQQLFVPVATVVVTRRKKKMTKKKMKKMKKKTETHSRPQQLQAAPAQAAGC